MISYKRLDHIHITVPTERLEEARVFYTEIMGLALKERPDEALGDKGYWFTLGDMELHIGVEPVMPRSVRHFALQVDDVKAARKYLEDNGVETKDQSLIPGRERFSFVDPFGNRMELMEYS
jgi:catechol 2,3-dioxygenase-like lactoylglutathione lyase family enzyme